MAEVTQRSVNVGGWVPREGATDLDDTLRCPRTWQCQENLHWSYSHLETSIYLHLSSFIGDFPICSMVFPWFSQGFPMVFPSINLHGSEISQPRYDDTRIRPWNKHNIRLRKDGASLGAPGWTTSWFRGGYRFFLRIFLFLRVLVISYNII